MWGVGFTGSGVVVVASGVVLLLVSAEVVDDDVAGAGVEVGEGAAVVAGIRDGVVVAATASQGTSISSGSRWPRQGESSLKTWKPLPWIITWDVPLWGPPRGFEKSKIGCGYITNLSGGRGCLLFSRFESCVYLFRDFIGEIQLIG